MTNPGIGDPEVIGMISGVLACIIFLIFHHLTISNIWFSAPFMMIVSAFAGYTIVKSYLALFQNYTILTWIVYNTYYLVSLIMLSLLSVIIFTPKYTSDEIINSGGAPPSSLIIGALPLTIIWMVLSALIIVYAVRKSLDEFPIVLLTSAILFLTLGLNISILGFVEVSAEHEYLVQKFLAMNAMMGISFLGIFSSLRVIVS